MGEEKPGKQGKAEERESAQDRESVIIPLVRPPQRHNPGLSAGRSQRPAEPHPRMKTPPPAPRTRRRWTGALPGRRLAALLLLALTLAVAAGWLLNSEAGLRWAAA